MNPEKQYYFHSETTTEETDHQSEKSSDENSGGSPFYECNFCKRGFTNAQALGGHMNIHRKEKAKTKPKSRRGTISNKSKEDGYGYGVSVPGYYSSDQEQYYAVPQQMNYHFYYASANTSFPVAYHRINDFSAPHGIPNLSLRVDGTHHQVAGGSWAENDIDLELHL